MASISADCPHPAAVSLHCLVRIMFLDLTCPELLVLHCPIICSSPELHLLALLLSAPICPALFHVLSCSVSVFLALTGSTCHIPSFWHGKRQCISGKGCFLLVSLLSIKSQLFRSEAHQLLDSSEERLSDFFQLP